MYFALLHGHKHLWTSTMIMWTHLIQAMMNYPTHHGGARMIYLIQYEKICEYPHFSNHSYLHNVQKQVQQAIISSKLLNGWYLFGYFSIRMWLHQVSIFKTLQSQYNLYWWTLKNVLLIADIILAYKHSFIPGALTRHPHAGIVSYETGHTCSAPSYSHYMQTLFVFSLFPHMLLNSRKNCYQHQ